MLYLSSNSTQAAFALSTTTGHERTLAAPSNLFSLGPAYGPRYRAVVISPFGVGSDNTTFDFKVWAVHRGFRNVNGEVLDYEKRLICTCTATLSATLGVASTYGPTSANRLVDTISAPTITSYATKMCAAYGGQTPSVHSPADDSQACLFIPELGNASDIIVEFDMTGATSGNCLIERGT